ncbi:MAG: hypothetical protein HDR25_07700 [Lachnospiraceae bacterium]|nr:hypothetical protein [Lachnospiraceae bacterium]
MIETINKEQFDSIFYNPEKTMLKVSAEELSHFVENENVLKLKIANKKLLYQKAHDLSSTGAYEALEDLCQINMDTLKKTINGSIKITRNFIYKFTVGLHMTLEEANTFFELNGGALRETCLADYICLHALLDQDDIYQFISDFELHTESKIGIRNRQSK